MPWLTRPKAAPRCVIEPGGSAIRSHDTVQSQHTELSGSQAALEVNACRHETAAALHTIAVAEDAVRMNCPACFWRPRSLRANRAHQMRDWLSKVKIYVAVSVVCRAQCDGDQAHACDIALMPETPGLVDGRILDVIDRYARGGMCGIKALGIHCDFVPCLGDGAINAIGMATLADGARACPAHTYNLQLHAHCLIACRHTK